MDCFFKIFAHPLTYLISCCVFIIFKYYKKLINKTYLFYLFPLISFGIAAYLFKNNKGESLLLSFDFLGNIFGALVGGLLAFWIAYIQIDDQRKQQKIINELEEQRIIKVYNLEVQKVKIELEIEELEKQSDKLKEIYKLNIKLLNLLDTLLPSPILDFYHIFPHERNREFDEIFSSIVYNIREKIILLQDSICKDEFDEIFKKFINLKLYPKNVKIDIKHSQKQIYDFTQMLQEKIVIDIPTKKRCLLKEIKHK